MNEEILRQGINMLINAVDPNDVFKAWIMMMNSDDRRAIVALDSYERSVNPDGIRDIIMTPDSNFIPYFVSDRLFFIENELIVEMFENSNKETNIKIDYSIMLDTNYSSYIDNFVRNKNWASMNNEQFKTIDLLIKGDFQYDYLFYMIENYKNSFKLNDLEDENTRRNKRTKLYQNLASLELFKNIDKDEYIKKGVVKYEISQTEAYILTDQIFNGIFNSCNIDEMMNMFETLHKCMTLLLIGILKIRFDTRLSVQGKVHKLFEFTNNVLGIYYEREFIVAHKFFVKSTNVNILNKINKGMKPEKLFRLIENMAWDFSVPRIMEYFLKSGGVGRFFVPFFLTNDFNLRQLLNMFKVKGVIFDKTGGLFIPFPDFNSTNYFEEHNCDIEMFFSDEAKEHRKRVYQANINNNFNNIKEEFEKLVDVLSM
ncbi:hypothetical protein [Paenibacillus apii]|uniref:hypothetical protein n=1 Tax=Paenibacillus apii TaxID=1850370 RepID=UPI00143AD567|nr:hypothetical protein [Paenibacillus apii]NJJ41405.1 hypothetical protein [Paenibacillus apii]